MKEYEALNAKMPRSGHGVGVHCHDVGLEDPSIVATVALVQIGQAPKAAERKSELLDSAAGAELEVCLGDQLAKGLAGFALCDFLPASGGHRCGAPRRQ